MIAAAMGWLGTLGSIGAYVLLSRGRWTATSLRYSLVNGVAGVLAGSASVVYGAWPSVGANVIWTAVAVQSALTTLQARRAALGDAEPPLVVDSDSEPPPASHGVLVAA